MYKRGESNPVTGAHTDKLRACESRCGSEMPNPTQKSLDDGQYNRAGIEAYEAVYGRDFVSPGGIVMARRLIGRLGLPRGSRVLDVGCGLGGSVFLMAGENGFQADGIDLSTNMIEMAREKLADYGLEGVQLQHGDCLLLEVESEYDAVYSRDVFLHIHEKDRLFRGLLRSLRPGARLLFTDYGAGEKPWSDGFANYVAEQGYCLHTLDEYVGIVESAGFVEVTGEDVSADFIATLEQELLIIEQSDMDETHRQEMRDGWGSKLTRARGGEQRWILIDAKHPER